MNKKIENITVYDIIEHFSKNKRVTCGNTDFITIDYMQIMALKELAKRELEENKSIKKQLDIVNKKLDEIEGYVKLRNDELNDFAKSTINDLFNVNIEKFIKDILSIIGGE